MASSLFFMLNLLLCLFTSTAWGLQVTPNSPCSTLCMDDPTTDASDPNSSNTHPSDIVCIDSDYENTSVGRKFKQCLTCLQNSTASSGSENDQGWFFYNLRFAFDTCLFNPLNASDAFSTPCSQSTVCAPIQSGVEASLQTTATMGGLYSYCTANDSSFVGSNLPICESCLRENPDEFYLSNFLVALNAGCLQEPSNSTTIGLNMTLFSSTQVSITNPITPDLPASSTKHHNGIPTGAIIGIAVAAALILLIIAAIAFIHFRARRNADRLQRLRSPLHERFGAENITAPNQGAYSSPQASPGFHKDDIKMNLDPTVRNFSFSRQSKVPQRAGEWTGTGASTPSTTFSSSGSPPSYSPPNSGRQSMPAHHAYIPPDQTNSSSRTTSPTYPPSTTQAFPAIYPQRSPSMSIGSAGSAPNTSPGYNHQASPSVSSIRTTTRTPLPGVIPLSRSASRLENRHPNTNPGISPSLVPSPRSIGSQRSPQHFSPMITTQSNSTGGTQISGPLPRAVNGRFENEEEAKRARERLYKEGLGLAGRTLAHRPESEHLEVGRSPESESSEEELWPGNY